MNKKIIVLAVLGAVFFAAGVFSENSAFVHLGLGTWLSGMIFFLCYPRFKEVTSLILGLLVLHTGVLFVLKDKILDASLFGLLLFIIGIVFVLNSGFSDYLRNRKKNRS